MRHADGARPLVVRAVLVPALGALVKDGLALVRRPQLQGVELEPLVAAIRAHLVHLRRRLKRLI